MITFKIIGDKSVANNLDKKSAGIARAILIGTTKGALVVQSTAYKLVLKGPHGPEGDRIEYKRRSVTHLASASPGAPANDRGNLAKSIKVVRAEGLHDGCATAQIVATEPYAKWLEYGTLDGKIKERPFMRPALASNAKKIEAFIVEEVRKVLGT